MVRILLLIDGVLGLIKSNGRHLYSILNGFRHKLTKSGDPDTIRTYDLLIRSQLLYPAELRDHFS